MQLKTITAKLEDKAEKSYQRKAGTSVGSSSNQWSFNQKLKNSQLKTITAKLEVKAEKLLQSFQRKAGTSVRSPSNQWSINQKLHKPAWMPCQKRKKNWHGEKIVHHKAKKKKATKSPIDRGLRVK